MSGVQWWTPIVNMINEEVKILETKQKNKKEKLKKIVILLK